MNKVALSTIQQAAQARGLTLVSVALPESIHGEAANLEAWQQAGFNAGMDFMARPAALLAYPERLLEGIRSILVFGVFYDQISPPPRLPGFGRVARYAWGRDYHKILRRALEGLLEDLHALLPFSFNARVFSDSVPLLERAAARQAALGFIGRNTMLIVPGKGSFLFLGEALLDVEIDIDVPATSLSPKVNSSSGKDSCGSCRSCLDNCPTGAFSRERVLDARRCISYLTIEKRGMLTPEEREWIGEWIFGCDVCQEVCPFNHTSIKIGRRADFDALRSEAGAGATLNLSEILKLRTHEEFVQRFAGTAIMRARRDGLVRNAAVVAANTRYVEGISDLLLAAKDDSMATVRIHALWAAHKLACLTGGTDRNRVHGVAQSIMLEGDQQLNDGVREVLES